MSKRTEVGHPGVGGGGIRGRGSRIASETISGVAGAADASLTIIDALGIDRAPAADTAGSAPVVNAGHRGSLRSALATLDLLATI